MKIKSIPVKQQVLYDILHIRFFKTKIARKRI